MACCCCCSCCCLCCWNLQNLYRAFHLFIIPTSLARRCGGHARLLLHHVRVFCRLNWVFQLFHFASRPKGRARKHTHTPTQQWERAQLVHAGEKESTSQREQSETTTITITTNFMAPPHLASSWLGISALCCYFVYFLNVGVWRCRRVLPHEARHKL